jgi:hypothetical protein
MQPHMNGATASIRKALVAMAITAWAVSAAAETVSAPAPDVGPEGVPVEEVLVTGQQPGPGLWKVSRPDDESGHVLWILGTHGPLPRKLVWRSRELESALATSQAVIAPVAMDAKVGPLGGITLLPSLIGIRDNPDGLELKDVVPAELYARWLPLKERYIGRDRDVEDWRPIFAAQKLYESALRKAGLERSGVIWPAVEKLARKSKVPVTEPEVEIKVDKPRAAIKDFKRTPLDDLECFAKTIERLESDLDLMRERANAWAMGDVKRLRQLTYVDNASACIAAVLDSRFMQERGAAQWPELRAQAWLTAVERAFATNASTVAVLSIDQILKPDGYVARLRAKGYVVEDP